MTVLRARVTARVGRLALLLVVAPLALVTLSACGGGRSSESGGGAGPSALPSGTIVYTAVGASDAVGVGSSVPCVPFTACPDGRGYVPVLVRALQAAGRTVSLTNLGVPGAVLSPAIESLGEQYGRSIPGNFLEQELPFVARDSTLVTVFAGGNDANTIGTAVDRGAGGTDVGGFIDQQVKGFGNDYAKLISGIRGRAPGARVIVLNLPNMSLLPYASGLSATRKRWLQQIAVGLSRQANATEAQGAVVVDLMCDARSYQSPNYSGDGFHPSDAGYAYLARVLQDAVEGTPGPPSASCSYMSAN